MIRNLHALIEFRYIRGELSSINRVPAAAMPIVMKYEPLFNDRPVRYEDGTFSEYSDLKDDQIRLLKDELTFARFAWSTRVLA